MRIGQSHPTPAREAMIAPTKQSERRLMESR